MPDLDASVSRVNGREKSGKCNTGAMLIACCKAEMREWLPVTRPGGLWLKAGLGVLR